MEVTVSIDNLIAEAWVRSPALNSDFMDILDLSCKLYANRMTVLKV